MYLSLKWNAFIYNNRHRDVGIYLIRFDQNESAEFRKCVRGQVHGHIPIGFATV